MKKKKIIKIGILNFILLILFVIIPTLKNYKYIVICDLFLFVKMLNFVILLFLLEVYLFVFSKKAEKHLKSTDFVVIISMIVVSLYGFVWLSSTRFIESRTYNIKNYGKYDKALNGADLPFFPTKITDNYKDINFKYVYRTINSSYWNSDIDLYLEIKLSDEDYKTEKNRIKELNDLYELKNGFYKNSNKEYVYRSALRKITCEKEKYYKFIAFFDKENKIIYNFTIGFIEPFFLTRNKEGIIINEICS